MSDSLLPDDSAAQSAMRARRIRYVLLASAVLIAAWGIGGRLSSRQQLAAETLRAAIPIVTTVTAAPAPDGESWVLAGSTQAFSEAAIYARTSGYVKSWSTDIGAHVRKGAVLAQIDTPDIDQQFRQAQADLENARAAYLITKTTNDRWQGLLATDSVSKQDAEQKSAEAAIKKAALESAEANLARLRELQGFKRITAPFDGVVTQRAVDIGALVAAGQNAGTPLFRVADIHRLRIFTQVPESYATQVGVGLAAEVTFDGRPGHYKAAISSTAQAIDPLTRTLQIELQLDNAHGILLSGAYARIHFNLGAQSTLPRIPVTAVLFRPDGLWVALVTDGHHAHLEKIVPGRDFGSEMEATEGLKSGDVVIANPPDSLAEGAEVRIVPAKAHG